MGIPKEWQEWRQARLAAVTSAQGNLSLIASHWESGGEALTIEGALKGQPPTVVATREERKNFKGGVTDRGIRLWDSKSEAIRSFETIDAYPYDADWVVKAKFIPHKSAQPVPFEYAREKKETRDLAVPGDIKANIGGVDYSLSAFDDEGTLILVFADPTNGTESYPAGRFLIVKRDSDSEDVILDFNRAYVPPCSFSAYYNCPLPPAQNRIHVRVEAGERNPIFRNGYQIH